MKMLAFPAVSSGAVSSTCRSHHHPVASVSRSDQPSGDPHARLDELARPRPAAATSPDLVAAAPASLPTSLLLSLEADVIAECLYRANALQNGDGGVLVPYHRLPAPVCAAFREAAIVAIQRLSPARHLAAAATADAVLPGFSAALPAYLTALLFGPAGGLL